MVLPLNNKFGVIKHECIVNCLSKKRKSSETLKLGTLIQITDYKDGECHIKIRDFTNWLDKYKTLIYKCVKDDYIEVTEELWPYVLASEIGERRIGFVQKVNSGEFNMDLLKLDCIVLIRGAAGSELKYFAFKVIHNGIFKQRGIGYFIGLELKDNNRIPAEFQCFTKDYKFHNANVGIIVSADWIIFNLYKEEAHTELSIFSELSIEMRNIDADLSASNKKMQQSNALTKPSQPNICNNNDSIKNVLGSVKTPEETTCDLCSKNICIGKGVILRECIHTFCIVCIQNHIQRNSEYSRIQCPYIKDYECQYHLLDSEIKDLTKSIVYNKILNNRLNEYKNNKNIKQCPKCRNIWIVSESKDSNFGRCPQCKLYWCYKCNKAHDPSDNHENETKEYKFDKLTTKLVDSKSAAVLTSTCDKCQKITVINECTTLQQCNHKFCKECFRSKPHYMQCLVCRNDLVNDEVSKITGFEMLKLILDSRGNHLEDTKQFQLCCCKFPNLDCGVVLQCKHKFCQTFLMGILQEQLQRDFNTACPICLQAIDDYQKKYLVDQMKLDIGNKCKICSNRAIMDLMLCRHSLCLKCVRDMIIKQALDPNKISINCTICNDCIIDSDVSQYGSKDIFALFKSKIAATTVTSKPVCISLNSLPFQCILCKQCIPIRCGVILRNCRDCFCLVCCREFIGRQLTNLENPACPCCQKQISQFEVNAIFGRLEDVCNDTKLECLKCEEKYDISLTQKCSKCSNTVCLECTKSTILKQIENNYKPSCPFCQNLFDETLIDSAKQQPQIISTAEPSFECIICEQSPDRFSQIVLTRCKHEICRKCFCEIISRQMDSNLSPQCPMCSKPIDQRQIVEHGISTRSKHTAKKIKIELPSDKMFKMTDESQVNKINSTVHVSQKITPDELIDRQKKEIPFECIVCEQSPDRNSQIVLIKCQHEICRKCFCETISNQINSCLSPQCPICQISIDHLQLDEHGIATLSKQAAELNKNKILREKINVSQVYTKQKITPDELINGYTVGSSFECIVCDKSPDRYSQIVLIKCRHEICLICFRKTISEQIRCGLSPQCPICENLIEQIQLDEHGIHTIVKKTMEPINIDLSNGNISEKIDECQDRNTTKSIVHTKQKKVPDDLITKHTENILFECILCDQSLDRSSQQALMKCKHEICRKCLSDEISKQINSLSPRCPICRVLIDQIPLDTLEVSSANPKVNPSIDKSSLRTSDKTDTCSVCNEKFRQKIGLKNCGHEFCRLCVLMSVKGQIQTKGTFPKCPLCRKPIVKDEIAELELSSVSNANISTMDRDANRLQCKLEYNEKKDLDAEKIKTSERYCNICEYSFDSYEYGDISTLFYCKHDFCRSCIVKELNDQSLINKVPVCPMCSSEVAGSDIISLCGNDGFRRYMINKRNKPN